MAARLIVKRFACGAGLIALRFFCRLSFFCCFNRYSPQLKRFFSTIILLANAGFFFTHYAAASQLSASKPKWQIGLGFGGQNLPDYRGSNQRNSQFLPVPIVLYSGRYLKIDRGGARGEFYGNKRIQINLSADAALNGDSDKNIARQGMPTLDSAFELGPSINIRLSGENFDEGWGLRFPLRAVTTIGDDGVKHRGFVFNPRIVWRKPAVYQAWDLGLSFGALWGSEQYHAYYYSVLPAFATRKRLAYSAQAGYSGSYVKASVKRFSEGWLLGAAVRYDTLAGATFEPSPLVLTKNHLALSIGVGRVFTLFE